EKLPQVEINPIDAAKRLILTGDWVEIFNKRGSCLLQAVVTDSVLPGVVVATGLWSTHDYRNRQVINTLTPSRLADMGNGATFFSTLVQVKPAVKNA
ncbi:MAG TPA: molybdopterin dinucleotide binding domain-containing protein, partial [Desulfobacteria bacterium]|nr:molybdopterin dinucleotide binding domain-containing protein [Desulfobacteria bacterium]